MSRNLRILALVLGLLLGGALLYWGGIGSRKPAPESTPKGLAVPEDEAGKAGDLQISPEALELAEIRSRPVEVKTVQDRLAVSGEIQTGGNQVAKVSPRAAGKIVRLLAQIGDDVQQGETLALLESPELAQAQADYRQAVARSAALENNLTRQRELARLGQFGRPAVEQSRSQSVESQQAVHQARHRLKEEEARLAQTRAERDVLRANLERARELKELVSKQEVQRIEADLKKAEADILAAQARIEGARGDMLLSQNRLRIAQSALQREERVYAGGHLTSRELVEAESAARLAAVESESAAERVRLLGGTPGGSSEVALVSPLQGKVQDILVTLGETVASDRVAYTVVNLDRVWAQLALPPKALGAVKVGDLVVLKSDSAPGRTFQGRISHVSTASDETTRAVYLRAWLENPAGLLKTGSFVSGDVITQTRLQKVAVPLAALQEHSGRPTLYVALPQKPGAFEVRHVLLGAKGDGWREVREGLKAGETVAVSGTFYLKSEALKSSLSDGCCGGD